jgi:hypothetical protein
VDWQRVEVRGVAETAAEESAYRPEKGPADGIELRDSGHVRVGLESKYTPLSLVHDTDHHVAVPVPSARPSRKNRPDVRRRPARTNRTTRTQSHDHRFPQQATESKLKEHNRRESRIRALFP